MLNLLDIPSREGLSFEEYARRYSSQSGDLYENFKLVSSNIERFAPKYDSANRGTMIQEFGFLWATENPGTYFYQVIKDTFGTGQTIQKLAKDLEGVYKYSENMGEET